jgi:hypothetical protein
LKYEEQSDGAHIEALVIGSEPQPYKVIADIESPDKFKATCSCPYFEEVCKHSVAVLLTHIARSFPGMRFDMAEPDRGREPYPEPITRARDLLDDAKTIQAQVIANTETPEFSLGALVLEKPLALIIGTLPLKVEGKVNILKVPEPMVHALPENSRIHRLVKYLLGLPQATKGSAGGHAVMKASSLDTSVFAQGLSAPPTDKKLVFQKPALSRVSSFLKLKTANWQSN